jgi:hypothetical protein
MLLYFAASTVGSDKFHDYHGRGTPGKQNTIDYEAHIVKLCLLCLPPLAQNPRRQLHPQCELAVLFFFSKLQLKYLGSTATTRRTLRPLSLKSSLISKDREGRPITIWTRIEDLGQSEYGGELRLDEQKVLTKIIERLLANLQASQAAMSSSLDKKGLHEIVDTSLTLLSSLSTEFLTGRTISQLEVISKILGAPPLFYKLLASASNTSELSAGVGKSKRRVTLLYFIFSTLLFRWNKQSASSISSSSSQSSETSVNPPSNLKYFYPFVDSFNASLSRMGKGQAREEECILVLRALRGNAGPRPPTPAPQTKWFK